MGIEQFFSTIIKNKYFNPKHNSSIIEFNNKIKVKHFFLDFNSVIHNSSGILLNKIHKYQKKYIQKPDNKIFIEFFQKTGIQLKSFKLTNSELNEIISDDVINRIRMILDKYLITHELETIYIAFDGVPSKGKLIEQKKRIYTTSLDNYFKTQIFKKHKHSKNEHQYHKEKIKWVKFNIKPGTDFMKLLSQKLRHPKFMKELKRKYTKLKTYIVSDSNHIGEGENKFMDYIRRHLFKNDYYVILGPDSDLILLTMLLDLKYLKILRYDQQKSIFQVIDIPKMKFNLYSSVNTQIKVNQINIVHDLVFLCSFFGNDFLPKIESYPIRHSLNKVLYAYIETIKKTNTYLIKYKTQYTINFLFLYKLAKNLSQDEINNFYKSDKKKRKRYYPDNLNKYQRELFDFENMQGKYKYKLNKKDYFSKNKNITHYYQDYFFDINKLSDKYHHPQFDIILKHYMEGLVWIVDYYFHVFDGISWWYYPYERAPLFQDIAYFLTKIKDPELFFKKLSAQVKEKYKVHNYFKPEEQIIYLSSVENETINILPHKYQTYINNNNINLNPILKRMWKNNDNSNLIDCSGAIYLSKCHLKAVKEQIDDKKYLKNLRKIIQIEDKNGYWKYKY